MKQNKDSNIFVYGDMQIEVSEEVEIETEMATEGESFSMEPKRSVPIKIFTKQDIYTPFDVIIEIPVKNNGSIDGEETLFVYVTDLECSIERPEYEQKAMEKVSLKAGESKKVIFALQYDSFGFYNEEKRCFEAEAGEFEIAIGTSSEQIIEVAVIELERGYYYNDFK